MGDQNTLPPFSIISKPRIDNIDCATYIFGALGLRIGFCFLQLNSIRTFFQRQDIAVSGHDMKNLPLSRSRVIKLEKSMKLKLEKCNHDVAGSKKDIGASKHKNTSTFVTGTMQDMRKYKIRNIE